jgi:hypothetical protein
MRLVRLTVERFQCIEAADVELGPGLNVLYGPNDLGKSSLAWAIRAVLLLQHGSSHAERFSSWHGQGDPRVALTLCDDDGRYWRVTKAFGGSSGRSALESSKDGRNFVSEASGREVDKRIRELLRWGLDAPGARGRQAFPDSFLTQVLLADQAQESVRKMGGMTRLWRRRRRYVLLEHALAAWVATVAATWLVDGDPTAITDAWPAAMSLTLAFGRGGCLFTGCCHGRAARTGVRYAWLRPWRTSGPGVTRSMA